MKKSARKIIAASLAVALLSMQTTASFAGWMDDWVSSKTSSGPSAFEGQARGYASGGSFSARWPSRTDYPISVQAPRFSVGCGGIDFNLGSLSFLKPEMLVKKLQGVLQNSAFVAFDMALDTLCPKCSVLMKAAEDISGKLNGLSMNDCNAAKGLIANVAPAAEGVSRALFEGKGAAAVEQGFTDSYQNFKDQIPSMPTSETVSSWWKSMQGAPANVNPDTSGCPAGLAELFPSDETQYPVSVMEVIGTGMNLPADHIKLMRGLVGDINIQKDHLVSYTPACPNNEGMDLDSFQAGEIDAMDKNGDCAKATATMVSLQDYVSKMMFGISDKLKSGSQALDPQTEVKFISSIPVAVLYGLRVAIGSGQEAMMIQSLSQITATAWMEHSIQDLLARSSSILRVAAKANRNIVNGSDTCNISVAGAGFAIAQKDMMTQIHTVTSILNQQMAGELAQFDSTLSLAKHLEDISNQIKGSIARNFSPSIADRVMRHI